MKGLARQHRSFSDAAIMLPDCGGGLQRYAYHTLQFLCLSSVPQTNETGFLPRLTSNLPKGQVRKIQTQYNRLLQPHAYTPRYTRQAIF